MFPFDQGKRRAAFRAATKSAAGAGEITTVRAVEKRSATPLRQSVTKAR